MDFNPYTMEAEKKTTLGNIKNLLRQYNAIEFTEDRLRHTSREDLYAVYSIDDSEPFEKVQSRAYGSHLERYSDNVQALAGFLKMGSVFILDKQDKLIYFLASEDKVRGTVRLVANYNPLGVDCLEISIRSDMLFKTTERFEFSLTEDKLMKELHALINPNLL